MIVLLAIESYRRLQLSGYAFASICQDRIWVWKRYGTAYRSIYTLYEPWLEHSSRVGRLNR